MSYVRNATKRENLVYDVGMHNGTDTDYYLKKGFKVIGFEADPDLAAHCRSLFSKEIAAGKLIIVEGAIAELSTGETKRTTIKFYKNISNSVWGTVDPNWAQRNELLCSATEMIEVSVVNFPNCLEKYGIPHYLKIDIEGMDTVCLRALKCFEQKPDYVSIESEKVSFDNLIEELNLLTQLGYTKFRAVQQHGISSQREPNPSKEGRYVGYQFQEGSSGLFGEDLPYKWKNYKQLLNEYKLIFIQYKLFGDHGKITNYFIVKVVRKILWLLLRKPLPGWYDTHAKHSSVVS